MFSGGGYFSGLATVGVGRLDLCGFCEGIGGGSAWAGGYLVRDLER